MASAQGGDAVAVLFGYPLRAGHPQSPANKILWIVRQPRQGAPLLIAAHPVGASAPLVDLSEPAGARPGEIYPSIVDLPLPGCWHLALSWAGHSDGLDLLYAAPALAGRS